MALVLGYIFFMGFDFNEAIQALGQMWVHFKIPIYIFLGLSIFTISGTLAYLFREELYFVLMHIVNLVISILNWAINLSFSLIEF